MELKLPEETLIKIGFRLLDLIYGELTIKKGANWDEVFVDREGIGRLAYDKGGVSRWYTLGYHYKDRDDFLRMIPVDGDDYRKTLKAWMLERYKRKVGSAALYVLRFRYLDDGQ